MNFKEEEYVLQDFLRLGNIGTLIPPPKIICTTKQQRPIENPRRDYSHLQTLISKMIPLLYKNLWLAFCPFPLGYAMM